MRSVVELASRRGGGEACSNGSAGKASTADDASEEAKKRNICWKKLWAESGGIRGELTRDSSHKTAAHLNELQDRPHPRLSHLAAKPGVVVSCSISRKQRLQEKCGKTFREQPLCTCHIISARRQCSLSVASPDSNIMLLPASCTNRHVKNKKETNRVCILTSEWQLQQRTTSLRLRLMSSASHYLYRHTEIHTI